MPYKLEKRKNEWCVINKETGENKGCSDTRTDAVGHMRVLYAAEAGDTIGKKSQDELIDILIGEAVKEAEDEYGPDLEPSQEKAKLPEQLTEKHYDSVSPMPYVFATSYADLEEAKDAAEKAVETEELIRQFPMLAMNIINDPSVDDKQRGIKQLAKELATRVKEVANKELYEPVYPESEADLDLKARWTTKYINDLPNSAFLYVEPDCDTKACRHFPYKDKEGKIDLPHLRNALSRLGQSTVPSLKGDKRKSVIAKAERILKNTQKKELSGVAAWVKDTWDTLFSKTEQPDKPNKSFMVWKDKNTWFWLARYSNNFRDRDIPPEIISEASHRKFVEKVEKGLAPYPELWLWHVPDWKIGKSTWVAYDDSGFAMAAGHFNKGCEPVAEWLSNQPDVLVSHGMPPTTIKRDPNDKSIIVEHESREISPLPSWFAANTLTDFVSLQKEANNMAIPDAKKTVLTEEWGMPQELIQGIEALNAATADQAVKEGLERKEKEEMQEEPTAEQTTTEPEQAQSDEQEATKDQAQNDAEPEAEETQEEVPEATEEKEAKSDEEKLDEPATRREIVDAFSPLLKELFDKVEGLQESLNAISDKADALEEKDKENAEDMIANTPIASLAALMSKGVRGSEEAKVDGRSSLAKQKPQETEAKVPAEGATNVEFINQILSAPPAEKS